MATRSAGPIPFVMMKRRLGSTGLGRSNELSSVTPAVLSVVGLRGPRRVANRSLVGWVLWGCELRGGSGFARRVGFGVVWFGVRVKRRVCVYRL